MRGWLSAAISCRCPACREGRLFVSHWYNLRRFAQMHGECPTCGVRLEPEPGFYFGAMFVSYAFSVVVTLAVIAVIYHIFRPASDAVYLIAITAAIVLLAPLNYRYSRVVFLYGFGGLRPPR